jgi:acyl-CoA thioesterase I
MHYDSNRLALFLTGGGALFLGLSLALLAIVADLFVSRSIFRSLLRILTLLGVGLVAISATPFPAWVYCLGAILWLVAVLIPSERQRRKLIAVVLFGLLCTVAGAVELWKARAPVIAPDLTAPGYVIGDSLSAGINAGERTWPLILSDLTNLRVINLAEAGATTAAAYNQTNGIIDPRGLVLVEIGGNDMLGDTDAKTFSANLDTLLQKITSTNHNVVMFELPLVPLKNGFGRAQRTLARKYGVRLIPKRFLTKVFGIPGSTSDGLHFTQAGHVALAHEIAGLFVGGEVKEEPDRD